MTLTEIREELRANNTVALRDRIEAEGLNLSFDEEDTEANTIMTDLHEALSKTEGDHG